MNHRDPTSRFFRIVILCLFALGISARAILAQNSSHAQNLQAEGIAKLDQWMDHKRSTGDASNLNELSAAESDLKSSFDLFMQDQNLPGAAWSAIRLADISRQRNQFDQATKMYQSAIELAQRAKRTDYETLALARLALTELLTKKVDAAKDHVGRAVQLGPNCGNRNFYFEALDTASAVAVKLGDLAAAADLLDRAFAMSSEVDHKQLYFGYLDRAEIYDAFVTKCNDEHKYGPVCYHSLEMARADYQKALAITQELGYQFLSQSIQGFLEELDGRTALMQGMERQDQSPANTRFFSPRKAKDVSVSESFATGKADPDELAFYERDFKEMQDWRSQLQQRGLIVQEDDPAELFLEGQLAEARGNNDAALAAFRRSVELLERDRRNLQEEQERSAYVEDKDSHYYHAALLLLDRKEYAEAFSFFEKSRSRAMADMLAGRPPNLGTALERSLFSQLQTMRVDIASKQGKLFNLFGKDRDKHTTEMVQLQNQIADQQKQYQELATRIARESPKLGQLTNQDPVTLESVQRSARESGYDVLYYVVVNPDLILWHINGSDVHVKKVFLPRAELTKKISTLQELILARKHDSSAVFDANTARELFLFLIQPVLSSVTSSHLVIIPHQQLNSLPFQVLQNPETGKFLGESFAISYAPSATVLATLGNRPNLRNGRLLAIADPTMHNGQDEVETIGKLYLRQSKVMTQAPVPRADLNMLVRGYDLVHLSVHGKFDKNDPMLSYLQFKRVPPEDGHLDDGRLTAADMFGLPLQKNSLVVLSACETGQVETTQANEILGMVRSLLYAGAGDLVLSLWQVDAASTKLWMETFYREGEDMPPAEAARQALVAVKSHPEYSHPFYWAPFVMTGK